MSEEPAEKVTMVEQLAEEKSMGEPAEWGCPDGTGGMKAHGSAIGVVESGDRRPRQSQGTCRPRQSQRAEEPG